MKRSGYLYCAVISVLWVLDYTNTVLLQGGLLETEWSFSSFFLTHLWKLILPSGDGDISMNELIVN